MKILIIEDDPNKSMHLRDCIAEHVHVHRSVSVEERRSYRSGLKQALDWRPDVVILDMSLPTYDISAREPGGRHRAYAGREILGELARRRVDVKVIIVTQFESFGEGTSRLTLEQLSEQISVSYPNLYAGTVFYHAAQSEWRDNLNDLLTKLMKGASNVD